jgi:hypothetical protein
MPLMNPSNLERYAKQLERLTQTNTDNLSPIIISIANQYAKYGKDAKLKKKLRQLLILLRTSAYLAYLGVWELSAQTQSRMLSKSYADRLRDLGYAAALAYAPIVVKRAQIVLPKQDDVLAYAPNYARLVSSITSSLASKQGFDDAGSYHKAKYKQFVRVKSVDEPREHSKLEGRVIRAKDKWNISGFRVDSPASIELPLSERAFCGHVNLYSNER